MGDLDLVDRLYDAFVATLNGQNAVEARRLAHTLKLAPSRDIPWSRVFGHNVTLGAPALVAEGMPELPAETVRFAVLAHMLAVIEAFAVDRIEDEKIEGTPQLEEMLVELRHRRDAALRSVCGSELALSHGYSHEDKTMRHAIASERRLFSAGGSATMRTYELMSLGKHAVGFPAPMALAWAANWNTRQRRVLRRLMSSVWLGLQMHDDVVDWEDDMERGGAWAVALMRATRDRIRPEDRPTDGPSPRKAVLDSGILRVMLSRARWHFRASAARANVLGAKRFAAWAAQREERLAALVDGEARCAGYAVRAHALAAWASEVLA
jgi:hypothetical protein